MADTFNVMGSIDRINELIEKFGSMKVTDTFPTGPDRRDLNVEVPEDQVDDLVEWCETHELECELV